MSRVLQSVKVLKPITVLRPTVKAISPPSSPINTNTNTTRKMSSTGAFDTAGFQVPLFGKTERQPTAEEKALVDDVLNLCECLASCDTSGLRRRREDGLIEAEAEANG